MLRMGLRLAGVALLLIALAAEAFGIVLFLTDDGSSFVQPALWEVLLSFAISALALVGVYACGLAGLLRNDVHGLPLVTVIAGLLSWPAGLLAIFIAEAALYP